MTKPHHYPRRCNDCGRFLSAGTWAARYDFVQYECTHEHLRCPRCTDTLGPAQSNALPHDDDMRPYEGAF